MRVGLAVLMVITSGAIAQEKTKTVVGPYFDSVTAPPGTAFEPVAPQPGKDRYALMVGGVYLDGGVAIRDLVRANSPFGMARDANNNICAMQLGDVLLSVNGLRVKTLTEFDDQIRQAAPQGQQFRFEVVDVNTGRVNTYWTSPEVVTVIVNGVKKTQLRFGVGMDTMPQGLYITKVHPLGPGANMRPVEGLGKITRLELGDMITQINDKPVTDADTIPKALTSDKQVKLTVWDVRQAKEKDHLTFPVKIQIALPDPKLKLNTSSLRVILVGNTDTEGDKLCPHVRASCLTVQGFFSGFPGWKESQMRIVAGPSFDRNALLKAVRDIDVGKDDTLLCFVLCHGGFDKTGHFLNIPDGGRNRTHRDELFDELKSRKARLTILATDACNTNPLEVAKVQRPVYGGVTVAQPSPAIAKLLFESKGRLSLNGSSPDQLVWYAEEVGGGCFTEALFKVAADPERTTTWDTLLDGIKKETRSNFLAVQKKYPDIKDLAAQKEQEPFIYVKDLTGP
jgi:hypothetical protein